MTNTITILAIGIVSLVIFIPLHSFAEVTAWDGWIRQMGATFGQEIYRVLDQRVVSPGQSIRFEVLCNDFDAFLPNGVIVNVSPTQTEAQYVFGQGAVNISPGNFPGQQVAIGYFGQLQNDESAIDITAEISIMCARLVSSSGVGGLLLQPDSTALFLAYGIANAIWIAPTLAGLAAGIYLTKSKWKR